MSDERALRRRHRSRHHQLRGRVRRQRRRRRRAIEMFADRRRWCAPGEVEPRPTLPSFLYLPADAEVAPEQLGAAVGRRRRATRSASSRASAAAGADAAGLVGEVVAVRTPASIAPRAILPWQAPAEVPQGLAGRGVGALPRRTCARRGTTRTPTRRSPTQDVLLTVPASFDAVARELTVRAGARGRACEHVTLLEEPQAAFYAWLGARGDGWRKRARASATSCSSATSAAAPPTSR